MPDRERILGLLRQRFPNARAEQLASAVNALVALDDDWEEVPVIVHEFRVGGCSALCEWLTAQGQEGCEIRLFRKRALGGA
jgi:hypothetical protein